MPTESFGIVLQPKTLLALQIACIVVSANLQKDYIDLMRKLNIVDEANAALKVGEFAERVGYYTYGW